MSPIYVPGKLTLRQTWQPMDPDAAAYITAVETADGQALEEKVKIAIDNFVLGCKADGIWSAIKASCILAGARTLNGALVPLVGAAPTNYNFVAGDYNRETGLLGDASTKYLESNRDNDADPQNNNHNSVYITEPDSRTSLHFYLGRGVSEPGVNILGHNFFRNRCQVEEYLSGNQATGLLGASRSSSAGYTIRKTGNNTFASKPSDGVSNDLIQIFGRGGDYTNARIAFYSIGESLDLALLDTRVTALITAIGAAL
jgi:hypothetical protein